ncbi:hypothetical protein [Succinatimonas hippei]|uniref:Uncharacterized protein n=1 Tax=Succinatimonas hippei (strain DSM 22608 / JCM 16073 / KCTC 15190 / YIT 12066) TaxID=762983 RepID=E8LHV7_SUCHY|nr:hypothetical protein [Succinatimonas hippei]EFY07895.1 hypothetical protein HMPREF9444_00270 [Succinatimonas hippei YIT 12066]MCL1603991.1 hypothetical protein [Succinatimonas hippei]MDM8119507.1 hypothetical protein [Succinatimonas hippei]
MKSARWILNITAAIALTTGCTSYIASETPTQTDSDKVQPFSEFSTDYFTLSVPSDWQVIRAQGPAAPAFISLINTNANAAFNLRITRSTLSIDDLCQLAAKGIVANRGDIYDGPSVDYGTCKIKAHSPGGLDFKIRMRAYDDGDVAVINYLGDEKVINKLLLNLEGNEKIMSLIAEPL